MNETTLKSAVSIPLLYDASLIRGREGEFVKNLDGLVTFDVEALEREFNDKGFISITVHDGTFHCDELAMIVLLEFVTGFKFQVIRSRTEITSCINGDVGRGQFDHHGPLDDGVRCAASRIYTALYQTPEFRARFPEAWWQAVGEIVDLVSHQDNTGVMNGLFPYVNTLSRNAVIMKKDNFDVALSMMKFDLTAQFENLLAEANELPKIEPVIEEQKDESVIVFDTVTVAVDVKKIFWEKHLSVIFMVAPNGKDWSVMTTPVQSPEYQRNSSKKTFNPKYCGLDAEQLAAVTGLNDAVFCHAKGFTAKFHSKESAVKFAKMNL